MRRLYVVVTVLSVLYFLAGWVAIHFGWLTSEKYFLWAGIVGSVASIVSLFSLSRPALTQSDILAIEMSALRSMTETANQLKDLEAVRARTQGQLQDLEQTKKEMALLVKKASLALFLKEQYTYHERQVIDEISRNERLRTDLEKAATASEKIAALDEEIEKDPNVEQLRQIIEVAGRRQPTLAELQGILPFGASVFALLQMFKFITESFSGPKSKY